MYGLLFMHLIFHYITQNVVVVHAPVNQPKLKSTGADYYSTFSLIMVIISAVCGIPYLSCTVPALLLAKSVSLNSKTKIHVFLSMPPSY